MLNIQKVKAVLGEDVANALFENFALATLSIPKKPSSMQFASDEEKDKYIFNLANSGMSYNLIAEEIGITRSQVSRIVSKQINDKI